jgi:hypothetical protein
MSIKKGQPLLPKSIFSLYPPAKTLLSIVYIIFLQCQPGQRWYIFTGSVGRPGCGLLTKSLDRFDYDDFVDFNVDYALYIAAYFPCY